MYDTVFGIFDSVSDNCSRIPEEKSTDLVLRFIGL